MKRAASCSECEQDGLCPQQTNGPQPLPKNPGNPRCGFSIGDKFSIGELTVAVAGVYASDDDAEENYIYTHLDFLQRRRSRNLVGTVTQFEVFLNENADAAKTASEIDGMFRSGPVETDTRSKGAFQVKNLGDLTQLIRLTNYLGYARVGLVFALVATTTLMAVQDRVKEHAVPQTIGFSGRRVFGLVLAESLLLGLAGGMIGVIAATVVLVLGNYAVSS